MDELAGNRTPARRLSWLSLARKARGAVPFALGMLAMLGAVLAYGALYPPPSPLTLREVNDAVAQAMASATPPPSPSSLVYRVIQPSLVFIETHGTDARGKSRDGLGSGVIIDDSGDILTSLHVVTASTAITVTFADGTETTAQVSAQQPDNDIAVLHPARQPAVLAPATLGNPGALRVGDDAYVVGNPLGLYSSMSAGVVSGLNRSFSPPDGLQKLRGLIQFDAAVNPGNSGGPLLNRYGQVVGIVAALVNPTGQDVFIGIGFAVPINVAGGAAGMPAY